MLNTRYSQIGLLLLSLAWSGILADERATADPAVPELLLERYFTKGEVAGAVGLVVAKDSDKVHPIVLGFEDVSAERKMRPNSLFWIASQTKPMTAVAVMMLVDEGKIALDDPVEKYLPEFKVQMVVAEKNADRIVLRKPAHPITIRETLCHMSGLPFKSAAEEPTLDGLPLAAAVRTYAMTPLQTEPGKAYQYSNAGINTAARIIEVATGKSYEAFMQERLFDPLGMKDTTFWPTEEQLGRLAESYRPDATKKKLEPFPIGQLIYPLDDRTRRYPMPAGGLFSTAEDVGRFCKMLLNDGFGGGKQLVSESAVRELTKRQTPESVKESYGLGFSVGKNSFGHGGAHATNMEIYPKQKIAVVWMVQAGGFVGDGAKAQGDFKVWAISTFGAEWSENGARF